MAATLEKGTSSTEIKELQLKINNVFGKNVVPLAKAYVSHSRT